MTRKSYVLLITLTTFLFALSAILFACGEHAHRAESYAYDEAEHWKKCEVCGEDFDRAPHEFDGGYCSVCGMPQPESGDPPEDPTEGELEYAPFGSGYAVTSRGSMTEGDIIVPSFHDGLPVVAVAEGAFDCEDITSIVLPAELTEIGDGAFAYCESLTEVSIAGGTEALTVGVGAFRGCAGLTEIVLPARTAALGKEAFASSGLKQIAFGDNSALTALPARLFYGCDGFDVTFGDNSALESLTAEVFEGGRVRNLTFGNNSALSSLNLAGCKTLRSLTIGGSALTEIESGAFENCYNLHAADFGSSEILTVGECAFRFCADLESISLGDALTKIGDRAFEDCTSLLSVTIPEGVTEIGDNAFYECDKLVEVYNYSDITVRAGVTSSSMLGAYAKVVHTSAEKSVINVTADGLYTYMDIDGDMPYLLSYRGESDELTLPTDLGGGNYGIYDYAFWNCGEARTIDIPSSVVSVGRSAFANCEELEYAEADGLRYLGQWLVGRTSDVPNSPTVESGTVGIADYALSNSNFVGITFDPELLYIGSGAFRGGKLTQANVPSGVKSVGDRAFDGCPLTAVEFGAESALEHIGAYAFAGCGIVSVRIPSGVREIGESTFDGCANLQSVTFDGEISSVGDNAFNGCASLTSIDLPSGVTSIGRQAFCGCSDLGAITFGAGSKLESVGVRAFAGSGLQSITLPRGVEAIGQETFCECANLTEVAFESGSVLGCVGNKAFYNSGVTSVAFPSGLVSVGEEAFGKCARLVSVDFGAGSKLESLGVRAFADSGLQSITLPRGVKAIEEETFNECANLTEVTFESGSVLTDIGVRAFYDSGLTAIALPKSLETIGESAFSQCTELASVEIAEDGALTEIRSFAFGDTAISSITIPAGVTYIAAYAFQNCGNLSNAYFVDPVGWAHGSTSDPSKATPFDDGVLSTPSVAAVYLATDEAYGNNNWFKV